MGHRQSTASLFCNTKKINLINAKFKACYQKMQVLGIPETTNSLKVRKWEYI